MACGRHSQREGGGVEPEMVTGPHLESPHFFKIILSDTLESGKLAGTTQSQCGMNHSEPVFHDPTPSMPLTTPSQRI